MTADETGTHITFDKRSPNRMAVAGMKSRKEYGQGGEEVATVTEIKLRDPTIAIRAIDTLNRMEGVYEEDSGSGGVMVSLTIIAPDGKSTQLAGVKDPDDVTPVPYNRPYIAPGRLKYVNINPASQDAF